MKTWQKLLLYFVILLYLIFGGIVFHFLETPNEASNKNLGLALMRNFIDNNTCVTVAELESFISTVISLYDQGVLVAANTTDTSNWDVASAMHFSMTIITTIGYGNLSPTTQGSRTFFALYAIFGIPLCLFALSQLGASLHNASKKIADKLSCCKENKRRHSIGSILIVNSILLVLLVFIQGIIFTVVEGWTYDVSLYYIIVSLTTVGFGDYVAGDSLTGAGRYLYRLYLLIWIFAGLTWFSNIIAAVQDLISMTAEKTIIEPTTLEVNGEIEGKPEPEDSKVEDLETNSATVAL